MKTLKKVRKISLKKANSQKNQDAKNLGNVKKAITQGKDLMYAYPKATDSLPARKKFRTDARRKRDSYIRRIKLLKGAEKTQLQKEANVWASKVFVKEHVPVF